MAHLEPSKTAAQLRHVPWLVLSAAIHGGVLLLVCALIAPEAKTADAQQLEIVDLTRDEVEAPRRPRPPAVEQEDVASAVVNEPVVNLEPLASADPGIDVALKPAPDPGQFDASEWSSTVGLAS